MLNLVVVENRPKKVNGGLIKGRRTQRKVSSDGRIVCLTKGFFFFNSDITRERISGGCRRVTLFLFTVEE